MAVSLPQGGFSELDGFLPDLGIASAVTLGGIVITSRSADPVVRGRQTTGKLDLDERRDYEAFLIDCADRHMRVDFVHPRHRVPRSYTADTLPFDGLGDVTGFADLRSATVSDLYVGLVLKRGDPIGFEQSGMKLKRWLQSDLVVSSATAQVLPITPRLPIGVFTSGAVVRLLDPVLRYIIVPGSISGAERYERTALSWNFVEVLK